MKKVLLVVGKILSAFASWAGPFGCVVAALALVLVVSNLVFSTDGGGMFEPVEGSADTIVTGIRKMSALKPYKVITAGFGTEMRTEGEATAVLDYQYKGMAEYFVDLSKMEVVADGKDSKVILPAPVLGEPVLLPLPTNRLWHVDAPWKMREWKDKFRLEKHKIMDRQMRQNIDTSENREKAKEQTERILRSMFLPTGIDESKIKFEWREDTSYQQN